MRAHICIKRDVLKWNYRQIPDGQFNKSELYPKQLVITLLESLSTGENKENPVELFEP